MGSIVPKWWPKRKDWCSYADWRNPTSNSISERRKSSTSYSITPMSGQLCYRWRPTDATCTWRWDHWSSYRAIGESKGMFLSSFHCFINQYSSYLTFFFFFLGFRKTFERKHVGLLRTLQLEHNPRLPCSWKTETWDRLLLRMLPILHMKFERKQFGLSQIYLLLGVMFRLWDWSNVTDSSLW